MVYDINEKRVNKVLKKSRSYLNWIQNSVFEGEISKSKFEKFKVQLNKIINTEEDSIIFFVLRTLDYMYKETMGISKSNTSNII
jgi:CRISPR-associated protein Cas2